MLIVRPPMESAGQQDSSFGDSLENSCDQRRLLSSRGQLFIVDLRLFLPFDNNEV